MKKRVIILLIVLSFFCHLSFSDDIENFYFWGGGEYEPSFKFDKETLTALPLLKK
jgi:hypothetical protein